MANIFSIAKGKLTNNKIFTYYIYGPFCEHDGLSNLAMCIRLSKTIMPNAYVDDSNPQGEDAYWAENGLIIPFQYFIIVTVYNEPAIGNM